MTDKVKSIFLLAAEPSGDQLGASLAQSLRDQNPKLNLSGIGGPAMKKAGIESDFDISPLAILGFFEGLRVYPMVLGKVKEAVEIILGADPDAVVLIDSWGFMVRVAKSLKKKGFKGKVIKYVAPQVWAMRESRSKILAKYVDHLLSIHSFDAPYFERHGLPVTFVGNPMFDDAFNPTPRDIPDRVNEMVVLFGSRPSEINRLYEPFVETLARIQSSYPDIRISSPVSSGIKAMLKERAANDPRLENVYLCPENSKYELFDRADLALACSGTVSTQLAIMGVPSVIAYKLSPLTAVFVGILFKPDYISLINISADRALMPEFVQLNCRPGKLFKSLDSFIQNAGLRAQTSKDLMKQAAIMQGKGGSASQRAASAILEIMAAT